MPGRPSSIGFGFQPFGDHPFGSADWAEETTFGILPSHYRDDDAVCDFNPSEPLRKYFDALKPAIQEIRDRFEVFPDLWDANQVPLQQLKNLGFNFNIPLESLQEVEDQLLTTIGAAAAGLDLSTLVIIPPAPIKPGTFRLELKVDGGLTSRIEDDGLGGLTSPNALVGSATIDYATASLVGTTVTLEAASPVTVSYLGGSKDERLQRSEVLNAIQFFLNKGIDQGYVIAGAFSGLLVAITPQWAETCAPGAALQETGPTVYFPRFDAFPADTIPADLTFDDFLAKWPRQLDWHNPCRSSFLKLFFFPPADEDDAFFDNFSVEAEAVINNLERVRPIHVRFQEVRFEGPPASGGGWTIPVVAENSASAGGWTIPVTAELRVSGGGWTIPVVATPTP